MLDTNDYSSERVKVDYLSSLEPEEGEQLIGKIIKEVEATEYGLRLKFTDNTQLKVSGHTYDECSLSVDLNVL